jgi:O-antigen/teichoic acid export membrane protein
MSQSERFNRFAGTESVRENLKTKSVHGAFFTAAGSGMDFLLRLASTAVLARIVIPEHWGLVGMVTAITAIAEQFRDLGLSAATLQSKEISHKQITNLFWVNVVAGALFTLVISAAAPAVSAFYGDPRLTLITVAISTNFFWAGLLVHHQALLMRQKKLPQRAIINIAANALSAVLAVVLAMNQYGYWALAWREMARVILMAAGTWALCPWVPGLPARGAEVGNLLRFGRDITLTHILDSIVSNVDKLLIGKLSGPVPLGMYRQGYWLIMAPVTYLCAPIQRVAQPALSALQADSGRYRRYYERVVFFVSLLTLPLGLFVAVYAREVILLVLGEKWVDAAVLLRIFAIASSIWPVLGTSGWVLTTRGRSKTYLFINVMHGATLTIFMFVGIRWGAAGIAAAYVAKSIILSLPTLHYSFKHTPVSVRGFLAAMGGPLIASLVMSIILILLRAVLPIGGVLTSLALGGVIAAGTYFCVLIVLPGGKGEFRASLADLGSALSRRGRPQNGSEVVPSSAT